MPDLSTGGLTAAKFDAYIQNTPTRLLHRDCQTVQNIGSFTKVSEIGTVLGVRDLNFASPATPLTPAPGPTGQSSEPHQRPAWCEVEVDRVSVWLPNTCVYILAALASNVAELCQTVGRRSSHVDVIKPAQVPLLAKHLVCIHMLDRSTHAQVEGTQTFVCIAPVMPKSPPVSGFGDMVTDMLRRSGWGPSKGEGR